MSVYTGRTVGNPCYGAVGWGHQDPGLAKLNYSFLVARGPAIFNVPSQDCSGVSVFD